jgi:hypothetical protein
VALIHADTTEDGLLDMTASATADAYRGVHAGTGLEERRYEDITVRAADLASGPGELRDTPDNREWWEDALLSVGGDLEREVELKRGLLGRL